MAGEISIWMPLYIDAWQGSATVQSMTDAEHRAFLNLLMEAWQSEDCGLPADEAQLAKLSRKRAEWAEVRTAVLDEFELIDGRYYNARLLKEHRRALEKREKCSAAGKAGNLARWSDKRSTGDGSEASAAPKGVRIANGSQTDAGAIANGSQKVAINNYNYIHHRRTKYSCSRQRRGACVSGLSAQSGPR